MANAFRRTAAAFVAVAALSAVSACSGVPSGGPARVVRRVSGDGGDVGGPAEPRVTRQLPVIPPPETPPDDIVRSFLIAQGQPPDDYAVARRYLAPQADWDTDARAIVYASREVRPPRVTDDRAVVVVRLRPLGEVSADGEYRARSAPVDVTFRLRRLPDVGWRVSDPPRGLVLRREDLAAAFTRTTLYWPDQARRLVPEPVLLRSDQAPVTAIVRALLRGPRGWVAPAVRTAIPAGTELLGPPQTADGVVTLNFSREINGAAQESLGVLVSQVVWTLTERPEVSAVRLLAEGRPLVVPGRPDAREHTRQDWDDHAPAPPPGDSRLFFLRNGVPYALDEDGDLSRVVRTAPLESLVVNRAGTTLAGVTRPAAGRQSLVVVDLAGERRPRSVLTADRITAPSWEPNGEFVWVVQTNGAAQQVVAVPAAGGLNRGVRASPALPDDIRDLRLSPDGSRAAVVAGPAATLWMARVEHPASGGRVLGGRVPVAPGVRGVTAVAFDGAAGVLFASLDGRRPTLHRVGVDGYGAETLRTTGLPGGPVTGVAVSAGLPADRVAAAGGRLWRRTPAGDWAAVRWRGRVPVFAG